MFLLYCTQCAYSICVSIRRAWSFENMLKIVLFSYDAIIVYNSDSICFRAGRIKNGFSCFLQMENANYYKIVQTIENDVPVLSVVAASWENGGILTWPPPNNKAIIKALKRDAMVQPGNVDNGWTIHDCEVKRSFIPTYIQAQTELSIMSDQSDTDAEKLSVPMPMPIKMSKRSAGARKIIKPLYTNADLDRNNYNQVYHTKYVYIFF